MSSLPGSTKFLKKNFGRRLCRRVEDPSEASLSRPFGVPVR